MIVLLAFAVGLALGYLKGRGLLYDTLALLSNAFNGISGGSFWETFCSRVGWNVYAQAAPQAFWRGLARVLDAAFLWREADHCYRAMMREHPEWGGVRPAL